MTVRSEEIDGSVIERLKRDEEIWVKIKNLIEQLLINKHMKLNEIKVGKIYKTTLKVQMRSEKEVRDIELFIRIVGKTSKDNLEVIFLNDPNNECHFLEPHQIDVI